MVARLFRSFSDVVVWALVLSLVLVPAFPGLAAAFDPGFSPVLELSAVTAGYAHSCALTADGAVLCWGWNGYGQLGDGTTLHRWSPVNVVGLSSGVQAVVAGTAHTCALSSGGGVMCWGSNSSGQLGDGTTTDRYAPVDVVGLTSGVGAIAVGAVHTCALTIAGEVKCWGGNAFGQLGDGTTIRRTTPVTVSGLPNTVSVVSAGRLHSCVVAAGAVLCWGANSRGQLGDGTDTQRLLPVTAYGLSSGIETVSAGGYHTCALTTTGSARCWGFNTSGQVGDGGRLNAYSWHQVVGLSSGVRAISAGLYHSCAISSMAGLKCWGDNSDGQLGDGTGIDRLTPTDVVGLSSNVRSVGTGGHSCAVVTGGTAKCWGPNDSGQLGDGTTVFRHTPVDVIFLPPAPSFLLSLSTTSLTFVPIPLGTTSVPVSITLQNIGNMPLLLQEITLSGQFVWLHSCPLAPAEFSPGARCQIHAAFAPISLGLQEGTISITSNATGSPNTVSLLGKGTSTPVALWTGREPSAPSRGSVSFYVSLDGNQWSDFSAWHCFQFFCPPTTGCTCTDSQSATVAGPGPISNQQFSYQGSPLSFSGQFGSTTTATGNYQLGNGWGTWQGQRSYPPLAPGLLDPTEGGQVTSVDGAISSSFPGGAVATTTTVVITPAGAPIAPTPSFIFAGRAFHIAATEASGPPVTQFNQLFSLFALYTETDWQDAGIRNEASLGLYRWTGSSWAPLQPCSGCSLDPAGNKVTVMLDRVGDYALLSPVVRSVFLPLVSRDH